MVSTVDPVMTGKVTVVLAEGEITLATFALPSDAMDGSGDPAFPYRLRVLHREPEQIEPGTFDSVDDEVQAEAEAQHRADLFNEQAEQLVDAISAALAARKGVLA